MGLCGMRFAAPARRAVVEVGTRVSNVNKLSTFIISTFLCTVVAPLAFAQPDVTVDDYCSSVTVDGIEGLIWRTTDNGITTWAILDANRQYLADVPARCIELLGESLRMQEHEADPAIQSIPSTGKPIATPIDQSGTGADDE
jgi:hypothetical protein